MSDSAEVDVAVVGAGAAGLGAADLLSGFPCTVRVLEARDRLGGRGWTKPSPQGLPLDLGCGWLHSGDQNPFVAVAERLGFEVDRTPPPWGAQAFDAGFPPEEQEAFGAASEAFYARLEAAAEAADDRPAADLLQPGGRWNALIDAVGTYINGVELAAVSVKDFAAYHDSGVNWRVPRGYGALIAALGTDLPITLGAPVRRIDHSGPVLRLATDRGTLAAAVVIVTVPSDLIAGEAIAFSPALPEKTAAAAGLPLGLADKLVLALDRPERLPADGHLVGATDRVDTGSYHLRPFGRPLIEGYFGGALARELEIGGIEAFASFAIDQLARLLGGDIRNALRPVAASAWAQDDWARGSYSHALPGHAGARSILAAPVDGRIFFAGEACSAHDFSTAHGAYESGRAAARAAIAALGLQRARRA